MKFGDQSSLAFSGGHFVFTLSASRSTDISLSVYFAGSVSVIHKQVNTSALSCVAGAP